MPSSASGTSVLVQGRTPKAYVALSSSQGSVSKGVKRAQSKQPAHRKAKAKASSSCTSSAIAAISRLREAREHPLG